MAKDDELEIMPALIEAPTGEGVSFSSSGMEGLFPAEAMGTVLAKVSVLEAFINAATRDTNFHDFTRDLLIALLNIVKSEAGSIFEADYENRVFFFRSVVGSSSDRVVNFSIPFGQGIVGHVAESKMPLNVENTKENKNHLKSIEKAVGFEARNLVAIPILIRGKTFGVVELLNRIGEPNYTTSDVELLTYLCQMAAKVIELRLMISWSRARAKNESR